jgi:hypothetical protein
MAELIRLEPLFMGNGSIDQLKKIFEIIGTPDLATLKKMCTSGLYKKITESLIFNIKYQ